MESNMKTNITLEVEGFIKIYDPNSGEVFVDKKNAINYENISEAMALTLSNRGYGAIYQMAFGNGGASVDSTGIITYLPPNTTGQTATLYNQTYQKIVDDTLITNLDATQNKMMVNHVSGKVYTDILVQCTLDYGEPAGQMAFDNGTATDSEYTFDELGLLGYWGTDSDGNPVTRLLTHVIFHPVQKSLNRQIQIDYTVRIQTLTNLITV
jgi:hypothetical protein